MATPGKAILTGLEKSLLEVGYDVPQLLASADYLNLAIFNLKALITGANKDAARKDGLPVGFLRSFAHLWYEVNDRMLWKPDDKLKAVMLDIKLMFNSIFDDSTIFSCYVESERYADRHKKSENASEEKLSKLYKKLGFAQLCFQFPYDGHALDKKGFKLLQEIIDEVVTEAECRELPELVAVKLQAGYLFGKHRLDSSCIELNLKVEDKGKSKRQANGRAQSAERSQKKPVEKPAEKAEVHREVREVLRSSVASFSDAPVNMLVLNDLLPHFYPLLMYADKMTLLDDMHRIMHALYELLNLSQNPKNNSAAIIEVLEKEGCPLTVEQYDHLMLNTISAGALSALTQAILRWQTSYDFPTDDKISEAILQFFYVLTGPLLNEYHKAYEHAGVNFEVLKADESDRSEMLSKFLTTKRPLAALLEPFLYSLLNGPVIEGYSIRAKPGTELPEYKGVKIPPSFSSEVREDSTASKKVIVDNHKRANKRRLRSVVKACGLEKIKEPPQDLFDLLTFFEANMTYRSSYEPPHTGQFEIDVAFLRAFKRQLHGLLERGDRSIIRRLSQKLLPVEAFSQASTFRGEASAIDREGEVRNEGGPSDSLPVVGGRGRSHTYHEGGASGGYGSGSSRLMKLPAIGVPASRPVSSSAVR
jgi:hypothetical protein